MGGLTLGGQFQAPPSVWNPGSTDWATLYMSSMQRKSNTYMYIRMGSYCNLDYIHVHVYIHVHACSSTCNSATCCIHESYLLEGGYKEQIEFVTLVKKERGCQITWVMARETERQVDVHSLLFLSHSLPLSPLFPPLPSHPSAFLSLKDSWTFLNLLKPHHCRYSKVDCPYTS